MLPPSRCLPVALVVAAAAVHAQPASTPAASELRPVVVTATPGLAQAAFDVPASIDVIGRDTLRNAQLQVNLSESLVRVPGVVALNRQNYAQDLQISIRGFGARSTFGVRGLRLYVDGVPATAPDGQGQVSHFDLASAGRIEVLRGPFTALYGNSSGGVISLFTADGPPRPEGEVDVAWGSDGVRRVQASAAGESGAWNYRASATRFETGGSREHAAAERTSFNGKLRWQAAPDTRVTIVANRLQMPGIQDPLGLTRAQLDADPHQASPVALQFDTRKSVQQWQLGAVAEHRIDAAQSVKLTTWHGERSTVQYQAIPVATQAPATHPGGVIDLQRAYEGADVQWVGRTRVADAPFTVTAGLYADRLQEERRGFQNFIGPTLGVQGALRRDEDNRVRSFDQYLQGVWSGNRVSLTAGVRHSKVTFDSRDAFIATGNPDDSGSVRFSATTPSAGLMFHAADKLNLYVSAGRGFETPTFNELAYRPNGASGLNLALGSARSRQVEAGIKAEPASGWRLNAALFDARTSGEIVVLSNTGGRSTFQNAGVTRRRGLEVGVQGEWGRGWRLALAASRIDATYASAFMTCVAAPCIAPDTPVAAGSRIPGVPRASAFGELAWRHAPWGMETAIEWRYTGRMAVDDRNTDLAASSNFLALRWGLAQKVAGWSVREFVRIDNVAGRRSVGSVIVNEGNRRFFEPAPGRTWLAGVNASHAF